MSNLPVTEELDFAYLLELMPVMHSQPEFTWLPELFSIIGPEKLITLCKYAGGESITIPTLDELTSSVEALQCYYDVNVKQSKTLKDVPSTLVDKYCKICEVFKHA